jgi:hypothetical protein
MKLLTKEILKRLPAIGSQSETADPVLHIKFFTPDAGWTWFAAEGAPEEDGDCMFWGYVIGVEREWGSFRLSDLKSVHGALGLPVERDRYFDPQPFSRLELR